MNPTEYQRLAARTLINGPNFEIKQSEWITIINAIYLSLFSGNICEQVKKGIFHQHGLNDNIVHSDIILLRDVCRRFFFEPKVALPFLFDNQIMIIWNLIGLLGEAAEIAELILDGLRQGKIDIDKLAKELGDCLWYIAAICTKTGLDLSEIMIANIEKLKTRYPDGYKSEDSIKRVDV